MLSKYWCITLSDISQHIISMLYSSIYVTYIPTFFLCHRQNRSTLYTPNEYMDNVLDRMQSLHIRILYIHSLGECQWTHHGKSKSRRGNFETNSKWIRRRKAIYVMREIFFYSSILSPSWKKSLVTWLEPILMDSKKKSK